MKKLFTLFLLLTTKLFANSTTKDKNFEYINLKKNFEIFTELAKEKNITIQIELWNTHIRNIEPEIYDYIHNDVSKRNQKELSNFFSFMINHKKEILQSFDDLDKVISNRLPEILSQLNQTKLENTVIAIIPSLMSFNGMVQTITRKEKSQKILMLGPDRIISLIKNSKQDFGYEVKNNYDVLVLHELFHLINYDFFLEKIDIGTSSKDQMIKAVLWVEGLATLATEIFYPTVTQGEIFMSESLPEVCISSKSSELFKHFKYDLNNKGLSGEEMYSKWFSVRQNKELKVSRAGYCLGYLLAKENLRNYSLIQLMKMNYSDVNKIIIKYFDLI